MPEQLKALAVIVLFGTVGFSIARYSYPNLVSSRIYSYWRNVWLLIISSAYLVSNYWIFTVIVFVTGYYSINRLKNSAIFLYLFLLPALPMLSYELPGFAGIRMIYEFTYPRMLSMAILLPLAMRSRGKTFRLNQKIDKYFVMFIGYVTLIGLTRSESITDSLRSLVYIATDYLLPYFVISRLVDDFEKQRMAFVAIVASAAILASVNTIEYLKHWFAYMTAYSSLNINFSSFSPYAMIRSGALRTTSVFSSPIAFGFFMVIAIGATFGLRRDKILSSRILFLLLLSALLTTLSRGPWVGVAFLILTVIWHGPNRSSNMLKAVGYAFVGSIAIMLSPVGYKFIDLLPFVGTVDSGNVTYRENLFNSSLLVIEKNLFFGDKDFLSAPELQHLKQGQGIIDIVNTYVQVSLEFGLIGLMLFSVFFFYSLIRLRYILINRKNITDPNDRKIIVALLAIIISILTIIATVSRIDYIPIYYLTVLALAAGAITHAIKASRI